MPSVVREQGTRRAAPDEARDRPKHEHVVQAEQRRVVIALALVRRGVAIHLASWGRSGAMLDFAGFARAERDRCPHRDPWKHAEPTRGSTVRAGAEQSVPGDTGSAEEEPNRRSPDRARDLDAAAARSRSPLRPPDSPLESQDA